MLTESQLHVLSQLTKAAQLFFSQNFGGLSVRPRLTPLVVGPTGSGKTTLVRRCAEDQKAAFLRVTFGDWLPRGAREGAGAQTLFAIMRELENAEQLVLQLDELDKCREDFGNSWARSVANETWNLLDGILPVADYLRTTGEPVTSERMQEFERKIRTRLFIVGTGTWQAVFAAEGRPKAGFNLAPEAPPNEAEFAARIRRTQAIPDELLARFAADLLILRYPISVQEKQALLDGFGLTALAGSLGETIDPATLDLSGMGMRKFESIATRLLLARQGAGTGAVPVVMAPLPLPVATTKAPPPQVESRIVRVAPDGFGRTAACLVPNRPGVPQTRLLFLRGKAAAGWVESFVPDPVFQGFDAWCLRHGLPAPPPPVLLDPVTLPPGGALLEAQPVATVETFYSILRHAHQRCADRGNAEKEYEGTIVTKFTESEQRDLAAYAERVLRLAIVAPRHPLQESAAHPLEIKRQVFAFVWAGSLVAHHWLSQHGETIPPGTPAWRRTLLGRVNELWGAALQQMRHLADWDSVTEMIMRPEPLRELLDLVPAGIPGRVVLPGPEYDQAPNPRRCRAGRFLFWCIFHRIS